MEKRTREKKTEQVSAISLPFRPRFLTRWSTPSFEWKIKASFLKYLVHRKRFPLFILRASRGGILANDKLLEAAKLCKTVSFAGTYRFSLAIPRWPSAPFNRMVAGGGLNLAACGSPLKKHIDMAFLGVSRKCEYRCQHCYEALNLAKEDTISIAHWKSVIRELQEWGTGIIILSGGEPLSRLDGIIELLHSADHNQSEFHLHTSGAGLTEPIAASLRQAGLMAAGIGLDDFDPKRHDNLRGVPGAFETAIHACRIFLNAGIFTYLNTCLSPALVRSGGLYRLLELAGSLGVGIVRLLEPRPCGGYIDFEDRELFSEMDRQTTAAFHEAANTGIEYRNLPLVSYEAYIEHPERMGCRMGGLSHLAIDTLGNVLPCVFLPVSFGNIQEETFKTINKRMRAAVPQPVRKTCPAISLAPLIQEKSKILGGMPVPIDELRAEWQALFH